MKLGLDARDLADMYFFEMLVRTHIAGEGVPCIGLKQIGLDLSPAVPTADKVLESIPSDESEILMDAAQRGTREEFEKAISKKFDTKDEF